MRKQWNAEMGFMLQLLFKWICLFNTLFSIEKRGNYNGRLLILTQFSKILMFSLLLSLEVPLRLNYISLEIEKNSRLCQ